MLTESTVNATMLPNASERIFVKKTYPRVSKQNYPWPRKDVDLRGMLLTIHVVVVVDLYLLCYLRVTKQ